MEIDRESKKWLTQSVLLDTDKITFIHENKDLIGILDGKKTYTGPKKVQLHITNRCNLNCIGCWFYSPLFKGQSTLIGNLEENNTWQKAELPFKKVKEIIDELNKRGTEQIDLSGGGEPSMHPNFLDIVEYIVKEKKMTLVITTNFTLFTKSVINELIEIKPEHIIISICAASPKTYVKTHPNQNTKTLDCIKRNLKYLVNLRNKIHHEKKPKIEICNVISNKNYHELEQMIVFAREVKADRVRFVLVDTIGSTGALDLNEKQVSIVKNQIKRIKNEMKPIELPGLAQFEKSLEFKADKRLSTNSIVNTIPCYTGWVSSEITAGGNLLYCCKSEKRPLMNILNSTFYNAWNSKSYSELRINALNMKKNDKYFHDIRCNNCDHLIEDILPTFKRLKEMSYEDLLTLHIGRWILDENNNHESTFF